jgi:nucleoside-diphosphate-sugar epimerase
MSVLVTGANGFLGSALARRLSARDEDMVLGLIRPGSDRSRLEGAGNVLGSARFSLRPGSLSSRSEAERALDGVDTVYHVAAALNGTAADLCLNTVVASKHLLEAALRRSRPPRFVLVSSFSVYGVAALPRGALLDERSPLEQRPERRDLYSQAKIRQERLFREYQERHGLELVVLRPGVIYGPGGGGISSRVGLQLPGVYLRLGGKNLLPLSYVDNCADAIALAGTNDAAVGQAYNVHDDDLPTCAEFLGEFEKQVRPLRGITVPYAGLLLGSWLLESYHRRSRGQLPAIFTPYKTRALWKPQQYSNQKLRGLGWTQGVPSREGMRRTFSELKARLVPAP